MKIILLITLTLLSFNLSAETTFENVPELGKPATMSDISNLTRLNSEGRMELVEFTRHQEQMILSYVDVVKETGVEVELVLELQNKILSIFKSGARAFAPAEEVLVLLYYTLAKKSDFDVRPMIDALTPYLGIKTPGSEYTTPASDLAEILITSLKKLID